MNFLPMAEFYYDASRLVFSFGVGFAAGAATFAAVVRHQHHNRKIRVRYPLAKVETVYGTDPGNRASITFYTDKKTAEGFRADEFPPPGDNS